MDEDGNKMNGGVLDLYMGETDATTLTSYLTGLTKVGSVTMTADGATEMTLTFDTPYLHNGGNLVFGNVVVEAGNFTMTYFTCVESGYDNCVTYVSGSPATRQFLPKTTFTYNGGDTPGPQFIRGDVDKDGEVGIADVTALIDYILNGNEAGISIEAADCDQDTSVGIADVTALIDFILNGAWS